MSEREQLEQAIAALEAQRQVLGDAVVDPMIVAAREKLDALNEAESGPPATEQRKQVTILFADISGFTKMAETMDPEEVHQTINALWEQLDTVIIEHGGTIDKHMGDAVMAFFGAPTAREDDPERAIRAALAVQSELRIFLEQKGQTERGWGYIPSLQMRIGIHTGPVLLGRVGTTEEYTAIGDAVNLTSRLQHAAPVGHTLISHDTYRHVRGIFDVQPLEPISVKGKEEPVQVYLVERAKPRAFYMSTRGVEGVETRMIGRKAELAQLQQAMEAMLQEGQGRTITIVGESGLGKSRLLTEFSNWLELHPAQIRLFKGRSDAQMSQLPYALIRDFFSFRFEIQDTDLATVARQKLELGIEAFLGPEGKSKAHFIGHLIGFDFSDSPYLWGILDDARQIRDQAFHYISQFFAAVTAEQPAVLFLEDIHWADGGALDLLEHLVETCQEIPLLIVLLARPSLYELRPNWNKAASMHQRLDLYPLSEQESRLLVMEILRQVAETPTDLLDFVVNQAEGNPFYIEELVKVLIDNGVIIKGEDAWQIKIEQLTEVGVPPTLTGVLQARLDRLPPRECRIIQQAAVVGRVFWDGAVIRIAETDPEAIQDVLKTLRNKDWLFERTVSTFVGETEYVFKHTLLHQVIYESVLKRQRRAYHAQVARWLIERSRERANEYAGLIGFHYERAGEVTLAYEWYGRAGKQAQDTYASDAAIRYYSKALSFLEDKHAKVQSLQAPSRVGLYEGLGNMLGRMGHYAKATEAYAAMRSAAEETGNITMQARAWERLAWVQDSQGDHYGALESAERAAALAQEGNAQTELVMALHRKGHACFQLGNAEKALETGEQALKLSRQINARREMARSLNLLGAVYWILGKHKQAAQHMKSALALHRELGDRPGVGDTLNDLASTAQMRGDYSMAVSLYQDALAIFREIGHRDRTMVCLSNLGGAQVGLGEYESAEPNLRQVIDSVEPTSWFLSETYRFLAEACLGQGKLEQALSAAQQALALSQEIAQQEFIGGAWRVLGMVAAKRSEPFPVGSESLDAGSCFAQSLQVFTDIGAEAERARTLHAWAGYETDRGNLESGRTMWQEAYEILNRLEVDLEIERMSQSPPGAAE